MVATRLLTVPVAANVINAKRVRAVLAGKFRFPTSSDRQNVAASPLPASHYQLCTAGFSFPAFHFWLFPQTVCALLETTNGFDSYPSLYKDDLNDDSVRNGCRSIERSRVLARQTAIT